MMALDTSIPLRIEPYQAPDLLGMAGKAAQVQALQQENQMRQMQVEQAQEEREAFKGADFSTAEGRNAALVSIMQKSPQVGMKLMKQFSDLSGAEARAKHHLAQAGADQVRAVQQRQEIISNAALPAWNTYQKALQEGKPEMVARAEADRLMPEALANIQSTGIFDQEQMSRIPRTFDPNVVGSALMTTGIYGKLVSNRLHEAQTEAAEQTAETQRARRETPEKFRAPKTESGFQLYTDEEGNVKSINPNTGEVKDVEGVKGMRKVGTAAAGAGAGGGAKVQQRVALVQGAAHNSLERLKEITDEYGNKYTTSLIFGAHPKTFLGKTAEAAYRGAALSDKQQRFDAQAGAFLDEAIPVFTGGLRSSDSFRKFLMGQLPQPGESEAAVAEKWRLFQENIKGMNKAFTNAYMNDPKNWGEKTASEPAVNRGDIQRVQKELQEGQTAAPTTKGGAKPATKQVDVGGQSMNAQLAPDGKYYVKMPSGKYAEVQE